MPKFNQLISLLFKKQSNWLGKKLPELEQKIARRARNYPISQAYLKNLFFAALWSGRPHECLHFHHMTKTST
ncbi:hypothetical protein, partial [Shewanella algae]|uniref:hypothetical protein n=1 Tax=Shewanella algae TaxID=38313 RepID=UPI003004261E